MPTIEQGAAELDALGRRLKSASGNQLRRDLAKGIRDGARPTIRDIRASALANLPSRGGLGALVAQSKLDTASRITSAGVEFEIKGTGKAVRSLGALNEGHLWKPVFGNRKVWAEQVIEPGFFTDPIEADEPKIRSSIQRVMADVARKIEG